MGLSLDFLSRPCFNPIDGSREARIAGYYQLGPPRGFAKFSICSFGFGMFFLKPHSAVDSAFTRSGHSNDRRYR